MPTDPAGRERSVARLLDDWPWRLGAVVIGGYVNAAYGKPRYSNDVDFVVPLASLAPHLTWLHERGFEDIQVPADLEQNYAGRTARLAKDDTALDLLPAGVMDRQAKVLVPQSWIAKDPRRQRLILLDASTTTEVPVCRPEAFWALKLQAGRLQDLADLFGVVEVPVAMDDVQALFASLWRPTLAAKLAGVRKSLDDPKVQNDVMSRRAAGRPSKPENRKAWERFKRMVDEAIPRQDTAA